MRFHFVRNVTVDPPLLDNQTEIIYSVFVSGIPVWAIIATTDMRLLNRDEVSAILEMPVAMIAERKYRLRYYFDSTLIDFINIQYAFVLLLFSVFERAASNAIDTIVNKLAI